MADERVITTVFKADISNFSQSTQQLNRYVSQVNSEFKLATASMGKWSDNADGLTAKITQLNKVMEAEKRKLSEMEQAYADLVAQGKENTKEAQNLAIALNNQNAKVKETEKNIEHYSKSLKELEDAGVETREELDKLNKENEELKQKAKELGGNILKGFGVGLVGVATACVGALKGLSNIVEETKELRTQMGQLETAFTEQGHSVEASEKTYNDLFAVLGDSGKTTEAALHLGQIAKSEKELNDYTNILIGVYAKFGDSLPVESLAEAISVSTTLGEANGTLVDALEFSGHSVEDFNAHLSTLNTEEEKAAYINETLNGIYGETAEKYKEVNKEVLAANETQNKYNQAMADIGEKAQPIITEFKIAMVGVLQAILEKFNEVDIAGLIGKISDVIVTSVTWILDNKDWLIAAILGIGAGFLTWNVATMISTVVKGIKAMTLATEGQTIAQKILNTVMKANPIGLVATAIGVLVAAFVVLWNKCEGFRNFFLNMWEGIKKAASVTVEFLGKVFSSIIDFYKGYINVIISGVNGAIKLLNKIKIPDWDIFGSYAGKGINIPTIPKLAQGGVVDKPTLAMVGEAGKEAVMPLENNTAWIDKLADKLSGKMGNKNVTYNVNNKFEKMESTRLALHKSNLEMKRLLGGAV